MTGWIVWDAENEAGVGVFGSEEEARLFAEARAVEEGWGGTAGLLYVEIELV